MRSLLGGRCAASGFLLFVLVATLSERAEGAVAAEPNEHRARAPEPAPQQAPGEAPEPEYDDYRMALLAIDVVAVSATVAGLVMSENGREDTGSYLIVGGLGVYAFGSPIVHLAHGQPKRSFWSLGLRVGVPIIGFLIGYSAATQCGSNDAVCYTGLIFGGSLLFGGPVAAMILDDGFIGKVPKPRPGETALRTPSLELGMRPIVDLEKGTLGLSLVGAF